MDAEASANWGLDSFALVEAAGRACAQAFCRAFVQEKKEGRSFAVLAGKGNNAADALVMLRALILDGYAQSSLCLVVTPQVTWDTTAASSSAAAAEKTPLSQAMLSVRKMGVPVMKWDAAEAAAIAHTLTHYDVIIDGITGTGLTGTLRDTALEMAQAVAAARHPRVISIDVPSGNYDGWQPGSPMIAANATLALEPQKLCLYVPAARSHAGNIIPVGGIFPPALIEQYREAELVAWKAAAARIAPVAPTAYKYERGLVEIRAGSTGAAGAARLAALGAQAAGAGLVRLIVDPSLYAVIAPACSGVMVAPDDGAAAGRFSPNAVLLGPGWGRGEDRLRLLENYLPREKNGLPLILDADAIALAKDMTFNGNVLITPHIGEFAAYTGLSKDEILNDPIPALRRCAKEKNVHILLKSHVLYAASPDGRIGVIDGMKAALAAGGSGDVLAGFCAAIAARSAASARCAASPQPFDGYACACAAASLLIQAAEADGIAGSFFDPAELARPAAAIAGAAWLPAGIV